MSLQLVKTQHKDSSAGGTAIACAPPSPPARTPVVSEGASVVPQHLSVPSREQGESLLEYGQRLHRSELRRLKMRHRSGMGGSEVTQARSRLLDHIIREIYAEIWTKDATSATAVVAIGGYGRGEL